MKKKKIRSDDNSLLHIFFNYYSEKVLGCEVSSKCDSNFKDDYNESYYKNRIVFMQESWSTQTLQIKQSYHI